jgi:hypothetical protein
MQVHGIKKGVISFGSASRMAIRGAQEGEGVRRDRGCGEGTVEVVLDVCQVLNSRCKLFSRNNRRAWLGKGKDSK